MIHFIYELVISIVNNVENFFLLYINFSDSLLSDFIAVLAVSISIVVPVSIDLLHRTSEKYNTTYLSDLFIKKSKLWWLIGVGIFEIVFFVIIKGFNKVWYVEFSSYIVFFIFIYLLTCFFRASYLHLLPLEKMIERIINSNDQIFEKLIKEVKEE